MNRKILVVDDDPGILDAVSLILDESGYLVETAMKGDEIFEKVQKFHPELILLDVLMSGKDGRDICRKLKADESTKEIPVIMVSAHPTAGKGALECGAQDFLAKPFDADELIAKIEKNLS